MVSPNGNTNSTTERVQYELEVITSGLEQARELKKTLGELNQTQSQVTQGGRAQSQAQEEGTDASNRQATSSQNLSNRMGRLGNPLREVTGLLSKLNPTVLLASLGLGSMAAAFVGVTNAARREEAEIGRFSGNVNLYSSANRSYAENLKYLEQVSKDTYVPFNTLLESFNTALPVVQNFAAAEGLVAEAIGVHEASGRALSDVTKEALDIYTNGIPIITEYGQVYVRGAEGLKIWSQEIKDGSNEAVKLQTQLDNVAKSMVVNFKRHVGFALKDLRNEIAVTAAEFLGLAPEVTDRYRVMEQAERQALRGGATEEEAAEAAATAGREFEAGERGPAEYSKKAYVNTILNLATVGGGTHLFPEAERVPLGRVAQDISAATPGTEAQREGAETSWAERRAALGVADRPTVDQDRAQARRLQSVLGLSEADFNKPLNELSATEVTDRLRRLQRRADLQGIQSYAEGGIVPGPRGQPFPAIVHGGERVLTPAQQNQLPGVPGGETVNEFHIYLNGQEIGDHVIERFERKVRLRGAR